MRFKEALELCLCGKLPGREPFQPFLDDGRERLDTGEQPPM
nr:hypothetical protein [Roseovarius sp. W115]